MASDLQFSHEADEVFTLNPKHIILMLTLNNDWILTYVCPEHLILQLYALLREDMNAAGIPIA